MIDSAHLAGWFDAHAAALILFARQWLERGEAEDVVQEVFVRLLGQGSAPENVKAWLFRSVRNAAIDQARRSGRRARRELRIAQGRADWFEARTEDLIDASAAQAALESLSAEQREVIVMRIWGQMTLNEIAGVIGEPISTLFSRYRAGLGEIKRIMESSSCHTKKTS